MSQKTRIFCKFYFWALFQKHFMSSLSACEHGRSRFTWFIFAQFRFNATWKFTPLFRICVMIFGLTLFGIDDPQAHSSSVGGLQKVTSLSRHQSHVWIEYVYVKITLHLVSSSTALAFLTGMNKKCKSTSPSAIQVKNRWKTISNEENLNIICQLEKGEWIVDTRLNVRYAHISVQTICDNADRITESA